MKNNKEHENLIPITNNEDIKKYLVEVLNYIDAVCKNNNLNYFIFYGTLLGAIRHEGFIPWDDDIDIVMFRDDYNRFLEITSKPNNDFKTISPNNTSGYYLSFAKVFNTKTILYEHVSHPLKIGVYVDIFPLDYCGDTLDESISLMKKYYHYQKLLDIKNLRFDKNRSLFKNSLLFLFKACLILRSRASIIRRVQKQIENDCKSKKEFVACLCMPVYKNKSIFDSSLFASKTKAKFESHYFCAPSDSDSILKQLYGDYMKLPPKNKRITHHAFDVFLNPDYSPLSKD